MIEDVEVETDTTLSVSGAPADAKKTGDEIAALKADLDTFSGYSSIPVTGTGYIVLSNATADINSPVTNADYRYSVYPCSEGDVFTVNATGASYGRAWGFVDANGNVLSKSDANVTVTGLVLTAPASAAYLVINDSSSSTSYVGDVKSNSDLNTEISVAQKKGLTGDYAQAESIISNSDLNDYTQAGSYKITTDTVGATIANLPSNTTRGRLFVMQPYNANRVIQMFFSGSNGRIYVRRYTNAWSNWTRLLDETLSALNDQSVLPVNSNAVIKGMQDFTADATNTMHLGYSWWVNNRAVDTYGNLYFGYISEDSKCGVCCRFPDGSVLRHDLYQSEENDDHNAPSVIIVTQDGQEYVCVLGSTGHNTDNRMHCYLATEPNSVNCEFTDKTTTVDPPEGYQYQCTYSQAYFDVYTSGGVTYNRITNFFRIRQRVLGQSHPYHMVWVCAISDDYGDTWKFYSVFAVDDEDTLFYMRGADTTSPYLKRIVLQPNTALRNYKPIKTGYINLSTGNILTGGTQIGTLLEFGSTRLAYDENTLQYDEFITVVQNETDYLYRILDVWETAPGNLVFIYARTTDPIDTTITNAYRFVNDWTVYRYNNGTTTEVAHLGAAFFKASHYVTGACFYNDIDHVIYSQNNSEFETVTIDGVQKSRQLQDGAHSLHIVEISNNVITSDKVIKTSRQTIARPLRYDDGGVMILVGQYREGKGNAFLTWHFGIQFLDVVS
jgi:hypothetical protein